VGRCENTSLNRLYKKDNGSKIIKTHFDRNTIESKLIENNKKYYKKVMNMKVYIDKLYDQL